MIPSCKLERMEQLWARMRALGFEDSDDGAAQLSPRFLARAHRDVAAPASVARCVA